MNTNKYTLLSAEDGKPVAHVEAPSMLSAFGDFCDSQGYHPTGFLLEDGIAFAHATEGAYIISEHGAIVQFQEPVQLDAEEVTLRRLREQETANPA